MGLFYNPPPPVVSAIGAQPYAPNKLPPVITAVPVNNPTPNENQLVNLETVLAIWNPDPNAVHNYIHRAAQPYDYRKLSPGIPGQSVDNPTPNENDSINLGVVRAVWDGAAFSNNPILPKNNAPGIPGQSIDNPPPIRGYVPYPPPPDPLPTLPIRSVGNPGWSVDNPPSYFRQQLPYPDIPPLPQTLVLQPQPFITVVTAQGPYVNQWMVTVISLWPSGYDLPQLGTKLWPDLLAVPVNNPPFYSRTEIPNILRQWQPPDPQPTLDIRSAGNPGWSVDNPPQLVRQSFTYDVPPPLPQSLILQPQPFITTVPTQNPYTNNWIVGVLTAWQPVDPTPTLGFKLNPQITVVPVNNPPFNSRTELPNILAQWQPPPPLPTPSIRINMVQGGTAPLITVHEWLIRARRRRR